MNSKNKLFKIIHITFMFPFNRKEKGNETQKRNNSKNYCLNEKKQFVEPEVFKSIDD